MDRLTSMAVFVKAVDLGSFTAAAAALGCSSQMVGKHVGYLEVRLGAQLLRRTTRRQSLTEVGSAFYERCRVILAETEAAEALMQDLTATPRGRLRVSAPVNFGACTVAPLVGDFLRTFPGVELELSLTDRFVDVVDEGFDAVFRLGPLGDSSLNARELGRHGQVACASPAYLATHGAPSNPDELASHACLGYVNWSGLPYSEWRFSRLGAVHSVKIRSRFQVNDGRVLRAAARRGEGIILQPEAVVADDLRAGRLVQVLADYEGPSRPIYLLFPTRRLKPPKLRAFVDHVVNAFGSQAGAA
ncbi:LysR family transcriptional regulator [Lichenibacterium minor]|uniref:LysR family transcriptional regulator n=1 Tax=Lichenibacterium minor TaxID=2316528 RepID=A0A4Q2U4H8_9HYPH|nr:LysR substrate-binding domain-containing protein [Lichenibacterium minor]RYC29695.1 LysR family transcriptional regulator [Lichenibacterium minor]